jgi:alkanesulfonate monooxygenase SsuD/methylene tetrahydromethanopterin reductase-like flavin-dependent oxidoreductase (luciferase family)
MPKLALRYDLRAPQHLGVRAEALYAAALEQCAWADRLGFERVVLSEHHGADDGYCPSPLVLAAAIAGRTSRLRLQIAALILPLHDPLRVAEDVAVLDLASGGRSELVIGAGYRQAEFEMFDRQLARRGALVEEGVEALKRAWTGEPFEYRGRSVRVTPRPLQRPRPPILLGGSTKVAARRAARIADGFLPSLPQLWESYREECERLGVPCGAPAASGGALFLHVAEDPEAAWARIAPHALHEMNSYGRWLSEGSAAGPYAPTTDAVSLRQAGLYRVLTPDECLALARGLGPNGGLVFHPLMGGLSPDLAWASLELFASKVLPHI